MNRLPLSDELPYQFVPPRLHPVCLWLARRLGPRLGLAGGPRPQPPGQVGQALAEVR